MDDTSEVGTGDSGVESISSNDVIMNIVVSIPELKLQKSLQFNQEETVWKAKQQMLSSFAKDLKNGFNYGFYCPPTNGKAGKFLDEERLLREYLLSASTCLEFKMKRKVYKSISVTAKRSKQLHSKGSLKHFMDHVRRMESEKIMKLLNKGMDPNFIESESGETPMTLACLTPRPSATIVTLVGGGAHLDFRNKKGLTPLHMAAQNGNEEAVKILLDLGSSTNYKDLRGLTPLYLGVCNMASARCIEMLLFDHATLDTVDEYGWTELHQSCKAGKVQHVELLIYYGADLNRQNCSGNTPLHIAVINDQEECVRSLMFRGADKSIVNHATKDAHQCAIISGNTRLAQEIKNFSISDAVPYKDAPTYNEKRRSVHHQFAVNTLKRCRSNPMMNSSNYETIDEFRQPSQGYNVWDHQKMVGGRTLKNNRRSTALGHIFAEPLQWKTLNSLGNSNGSFSISSADSSQEGEVILEQKKVENLRSKFSGARQVVLQTDSADFGFILRGARADKINSSKADLMLTPSQPALQYFEHVKANSLAHKAGIKPGDFLLEVNGVDVSSASHEFAVSLIRNSVQTLQMLVMTPKQHHIYNIDSVDSRVRTNSTLKELKNSLSFKTFFHPVTSESNCSELKVASIRSVHGKRLAHDLPGDDPDSVRVVSVPTYNPNSISRKFLWKTKSLHNLSGSDDICYMFDEDDRTAVDVSNDTREPTLFGIFGVKEENVRELEKKPVNEKSFTCVQEKSSSPGPALKKTDQNLSSFLSPSHQKLQQGLKPDTESKILASLTTPPLPSPPPPPPPLPALHNLCDQEYQDFKRHQDLDFLTLAENARQVFLRHQKTSVDEMTKPIQKGSTTKDVVDNDVSIKNRYALEPYAMYNTTREISKLALVSNRRQIFEVNGDKSNEPDQSCNVTDSRNKDIFIDKWNKKRPIPPKPLQKPSYVFQSNIPAFFQTIPRSFPNCDVNTNAIQSSDNNPSQFSHSASRFNGSMNVSLTSADSEILFVPPPPGFEDEVEQTSSLISTSDRRLQMLPHSFGSQTKRLKETMDKWTVNDVGDWLDSMDMGEHREMFSRNNIDGRKLSTLGRNDLISLGVVQVGQRMGLERAVKKILISYSSS